MHIYIYIYVYIYNTRSKRRIQRGHKFGRINHNSYGSTLSHPLNYFAVTGKYGWQLTGAVIAFQSEGRKYETSFDLSSTNEFSPYRLGNIHRPPFAYAAELQSTFIDLSRNASSYHTVRANSSLYIHMFVGNRAYTMVSYVVCDRRPTSGGAIRILHSCE